MSHYEYGPHPDYPTGWVVRNTITGIEIGATSEEAILKIIALAKALRGGLPKPVNHVTLEKKAKWLEGFYGVERFHTWDGKKRPYTKRQGGLPK